MERTDVGETIVQTKKKVTWSEDLAQIRILTPQNSLLVVPEESEDVEEADSVLTSSGVCTLNGGLVSETVQEYGKDSAQKDLRLLEESLERIFGTRLTIKPCSY